MTRPRRRRAGQRPPLKALLRTPSVTYHSESPRQPSSAKSPARKTAEKTKCTSRWGTRERLENTKSPAPAASLSRDLHQVAQTLIDVAEMRPSLTVDVNEVLRECGEGGVAAALGAALNVQRRSPLSSQGPTLSGQTRSVGIPSAAQGHHNAQISTGYGNAAFVTGEVGSHSSDLNKQHATLTPPETASSRRHRLPAAVKPVKCTVPLLHGALMP